MIKDFLYRISIETLNPQLKHILQPTALTAPLHTVVLYGKSFIIEEPCWELKFTYKLESVIYKTMCAHNVLFFKFYIFVSWVKKCKNNLYLQIIKYAILMVWKNGYKMTDSPKSDS